MRFIKAVEPREADGLVAQVYGEIKHDFALLRDPDGNSPFMAHSPHPELLAGLWSVLYETILVEGVVRRADKEAIGATLAFHYVNRTVEVFQGHGPMPLGPAPLRGVTMKLLGRVAARALRRGREPGRTLSLLPERQLPDDLGWARRSPAVASAMAR